MAEVGRRQAQPVRPRLGQIGTTRFQIEQDLQPATPGAPSDPDHPSRRVSAGYARLNI